MFVKVNNLLKLPYSKKWNKLSFGCSTLDVYTSGGIIARGITEICGEAGTGKSQMLMQLCLTVQLPKLYGGFQKKAIIIYTEGHFPLKRLVQIANYFEKIHKIKVKSFLDGIYIKHVLYADKLMEIISNELIKMLEKDQIGLVVIDSIGAIFRGETGYIERAKKLRLLTHKLLQIIESFNCVVVCSNQVSSFNSMVVPSLGLTWSHQIRTRLMIKKDEISNDSSNPSNSNTSRKLEILYSPELKCGTVCEFFITNDGIADVF